MGLIFTLIVVGLVLLMVEVYFTPGSTIFGILGLACIIIANVMAFDGLDSWMAWTIFIISALITALFLILLIRMLSSKNFVVNKEIKDKVNVIDETKFEVGDKGITLTTLRPNGRAEFNNEIIEVFSNGTYIDDNTDIEITKVTTDKLFVKTI